MVDDAARTEDWEERSSSTYRAATDRCLDLISSMTGWIFDSVRPAKIMRAGAAAARDRTVSAPMAPVEGPVMATVEAVRWRFGRRGKGDG